MAEGTGSVPSVSRSEAPASVPLLRQELKEQLLIFVLIGRCASAEYLRTLFGLHLYHLSRTMMSLAPDAVGVKAY